MSLWPADFPPRPTAETVIDSDEELDDTNERITVGSHKPSKGGVDVPVVKGGSKSSSNQQKRKEDHRHSSTSVKDKAKRFSGGAGGLVDDSKRQQARDRSRTISNPINNNKSGKSLSRIYKVLFFSMLRAFQVFYALNARCSINTIVSFFFLPYHFFAC